MSSDIVANLPHVETTLNYLVDRTEKPVAYMYTPPPDTPPRTGRYGPYPVSIYDGRGILPQISLDTYGFQLTHHDTKVVNFYDEDEVRAVYYPEVERLLKEVTGAVKVLVFDHNVRCQPMSQRGENGAREPVKSAHNDYTLRSGPQRVRDLLDADEAEERLRHRFAEINVWRPIRGPVEEAPLAVCDARSMVLEDFVAMDLKYRDRTGEVYSVAFNSSHRWFYFPHMQKNEALLLKCYDSMTDGRARFTAHTAFDDPTSPSDAPARESIEARTLVFFAPESKAKS
jgi:hypothetical protein